MVTKKTQHFRPAVAVCVPICVCLFVHVYFVLSRRIKMFGFFINSQSIITGQQLNPSWVRLSCSYTGVSELNCVTLADFFSFFSFLVLGRLLCDYISKKVMHQLKNPVFPILHAQKEQKWSNTEVHQSERRIWRCMSCSAFHNSANSSSLSSMWLCCIWCKLAESINLQRLIYRLLAAITSFTPRLLCRPPFYFYICLGHFSTF